MKKNIILTALIAVCGLPALAQVQFGVKGGLNIATVKYKEIDPNTASIGFHAGLLAQADISHDFFIRPEIQYAVKGYRSPVVGANGTGTMHMNYITLPILAGFTFAEKFQGLIGPEFGYLSKATSVFSGHRQNATDIFQRFDWGLDVGAAYTITPALGVEVRYNYGFRGLLRGITVDENGNPTGSAKDGANRVFQAGLYYLFTK